MAEALREAKDEVFSPARTYGGSPQADFYFRRLVDTAISNGEDEGHFCVGGSPSELENFLKDSRTAWIEKVKETGGRKSREYQAEDGSIVLQSKWSSDTKSTQTTRNEIAGFTFRPASTKGEGSDFLLYGWVKGSLGGREVETPRFESVPEKVRLRKPSPPKVEEAPPETISDVTGGEGTIQRNVEMLNELANDPVLQEKYRAGLANMSPEGLVQHDFDVQRLRKSGNHVGLLAKILGALTACLLLYLPFREPVDAAITRAFEAFIEVFGEEVPEPTAPPRRPRPSPPPRPTASPAPTPIPSFAHAPAMVLTAEGKNLPYLFRFVEGARLEERAGVTGLAWGRNCWAATEMPGKVLVTFYTTPDDRDLHVYAFSGFRVNGSCLGGIRLDPISEPASPALNLVREGDRASVAMSFGWNGAPYPKAYTPGTLHVDRVNRDGQPFCRALASAPSELATQNTFAVSFGYVPKGDAHGRSVEVPRFGTFVHEKAKETFSFRLIEIAPVVPPGTVTTETQFRAMRWRGTTAGETIGGPVACEEKDRLETAPPR